VEGTGKCLDTRGDEVPVGESGYNNNGKTSLAFWAVMQLDSFSRRIINV
jgi:hypothetical protein